MIIFGTRTTVRLLAILNLVCARCGNPAAHRIEERRRKFTLFFVPLFPIGARRTYGTCTYCGLVTELDAEHARAPSGRGRAARSRRRGEAWSQTAPPNV